MDTLLFNKPYILGLDLGIASVGWSVVEINEKEEPVALIDLGVRTFEKAEVPKTGESLAANRRNARSIRRLIRRRAHRQLRLNRKMKQIGLLAQQDVGKDNVVSGLPVNVWQLRVKGLDEKLTRYEWAAVIKHIVKHRGYRSMRKNEETGDNKELGRLLQGVKENNLLMQDKHYRTAAELALNEFTHYFRNKGGSYSHTFSRQLLKDELQLLFTKQREFSNLFATSEFEQFVVELLMSQRPALSGNAILAMLGKCQFETTEYKAAKHSYSAERFVWLTKLNNLRFYEQGEERALTLQEIHLLIDEPYKKVKLTYLQVKTLLDLPENVRFKGLRYSEDKLPEEIEKQTLMELKGFHKLRQTFEKSGLKTEWQGLASQSEKLDKIVTALSIYKTDEDILQALEELVLSDNVKQALLNISFNDFIQLSLKALKNIVPLMEQGNRYDQAIAELYPNCKQQGEANLFLPTIPGDDIRNPVVFRALTQARKVINAVIRQYGSPARVHIETAREVGKSFKDRRAIEKQQQENRNKNERERERFKEYFPHFGEPKSRDILKLRLYEEQNGQCTYSGKAIDITRLMENNYVEIDHVLPYSRSWDDSYNNKTLVLASTNQNKGNQTPYEWFNGKDNSTEWQNFQGRINSLKIALVKKQRLLSKTISNDFIERNLNDTRWISRFLVNFIKENLQLTGKGKDRVFASNGQLTALLRGRWGLNKLRSENDRHHARDAVVVACSTLSMLQRITNYVRYNELKNIKGNQYVDPVTGEWIDLKQYQHEKLHFPPPWHYFREEVDIRICSDNPAQILKQELPDRQFAHHSFVRPLFVSRAVNQKVTGQAHQDTIRSAKRIHEGISVSKVSLTSLKISDLERLVNREREPQLLLALQARLEQFNGDGAKAFQEPFYKPDRNGKLGAQVKSVKLEKVQNTGVRVRQNKMGIADNASMVRVDVFTKNGKFFAIPVYTWQVAIGLKPNLAVVANKPESEWTEIDESYQFLFNLFSNDLIKITLKKETWFGYFIGLHRGTGAVNILAHDRSMYFGKDGMKGGIGIKTALTLEKYRVNVLGDVYPVRKEKKIY